PRAGSPARSSPTAATTTSTTGASSTSRPTAGCRWTSPLAGCIPARTRNPATMRWNGSTSAAWMLGASPSTATTARASCRPSTRSAPTTWIRSAAKSSGAAATSTTTSGTTASTGRPSTGIDPIIDSAMNLPATDTLPSTHFDSVDLVALAGRYGTPLHAYSASAIRQRIGGLQQALHGMDAMICYAVKANGNRAILELMAQAGLGADIVSAGELQRALRA